MNLHSNLHTESFILLVFLLLIILYYDIQIIFSQLKVILNNFFIENFCINWRWPQNSNFLNWLRSNWNRHREMPFWGILVSYPGFIPLVSDASNTPFTAKITRRTNYTYMKLGKPGKLISICFKYVLSFQTFNLELLITTFWAKWPYQPRKIKGESISWQLFSCRSYPEQHIKWSD